MQLQLLVTDQQPVLRDRSGLREHEENKEAANYDGSQNEPTAIRTPSIVAGRAIAVAVVRAISTPNIGHESA